MAAKTKSTKDFHKKLLENEFPDNMDTLSFCNQLLEKLGRGSGGAGGKALVGALSTNSVAPVAAVTNAELLRKSQAYKLVDMDEMDKVDTSHRVGGSSSSREERSEKKAKKHMRKKTDEGSSSEDDTQIRRKAPKVEVEVPLTEEEKKQREREVDLAERDAFVSRMLEREEKKTKKADQGGLSASQIEQLATRGVITGDKAESR